MRTFSYTSTGSLPSGWPHLATEATSGDCIETTGLVVIDLDVNHASGHDGIASWDALGFKDSTVSQTTKSGGKHLFWRLPDGEDPADFRSSASVLGAGVDVKAWHSFVRVYDPAILDVRTEDLPVAPKALLDAVRKVPVERTVEARSTASYAPSVHPWVEAAVRAIEADLRASTDGQHHSVQRDAAFRLVGLSNNPRSGLTPEVAHERWRNACAVYDGASEPRWDSAVEKWEGAQAHVPGDEDATETDPLAADVEAEVRRITVKQRAEAEVAAANYTPTRVVTLDELLADDPSWLVADVIAEGSTNFLVARPNLGKTFLMIDLACTMALGRSWMGKATSATNVVYVLAEGANAHFAHRVVAWCEANGADVREVSRRFTFMASANLNNPQFLAELKAQVEASGAGLVIVDTYAAASGVQSEDDNALNAMTLNNARSAVGDAALLFAHHPNKASENTSKPLLRGASALAGAADAVFTLHEVKDDDGGSTLTLSSEHSHGGKNRNAPTETFRGLYIDGLGNSAVVRVDRDAANANLSVGERAVLENMTKDGMTAQQFADVIGKPYSTAHRYLANSKFTRKEGNLYVLTNA